MATNTEATLTLLAQLKDEASAKLKTLGGTVEGVDALQKKAAQSVQNLADKYAIQARQAEQLNAKYQALDQSTAKGAQQAEQLQIRQANLELAMTKTVQSAEREAQAMNQVAQAEAALASQTTITNTTITNLNESIATNTTTIANSSSVFNTTSTSLGGLIKNVAGAAAGYASLSAIAGAASDGFKITATLDQNRRSLGTLLQDVDKGNETYQRAIQWGDQYAIKQSEIGAAVSGAALIIKNSNQPIEAILDTLSRLGSLNPTEGIEGATFALKELASGDTTSIVERFNLSRDAANEMKAAIQGGADPVKVLDDALRNMGITSQVLKDQLEGPAGAIRLMEQSTEKAKIALGNFLIAAGATDALTFLAEKLGLAADQMDRFRQNDGSGDQQVQGLAVTAQSYQQYAAAIDAANAAGTRFDAGVLDRLAALGPLGQTLGGLYTAYQGLAGETTKLSEAEFALVQSLIAQGMSAEQAVARAQALVQVETNLSNAWQYNTETAVLNAEAKRALAEETMLLAAQSPELQAAVEALSASLADGSTSPDEYRAKLEELSNAMMEDAEEARRLEGAALVVTQGLAEATGISDELTNAIYAQADAFVYAGDEILNTGDALYDTTAEQIANAAAAEQAAMFNADLALMMDRVANGELSTAGASAYLSQMYGIEIGKVRTLIDGYNNLNAARAGRMGVSLGRDIAGALERDIAIAPSYAPGGAFDPKRHEKAKKGRSGGGRKAGKSDEEKAAEKAQKAQEKADKKAEADRQKHLEKLADLEETYADKQRDLDQKHAETRAKIWADYYAKQKAQTEQFNSEKFDDELSFRDNLANLDAQSRNEDIAKERAAWDESQAIAQAGNAKLADDYYQMRLAQIAADRERAETIKQLEKDITEAEDAETKARLESQLAYERDQDARHDQRDAEKLEQLKQGGVALANERDEQLAEEDQKYTDANAKLRSDFEEAVNDVTDSIDNLTTEISQAAQAMIEDFNALSAAAAAAASHAATEQGVANQTAPVQGSYALGTGPRGVPRDGLYELHKPERVLNQDETAQYNMLESRGLLDGSGGGMGSMQTFAGSTAPSSVARSAGGSSSHTEFHAPLVGAGAIVINGAGRNARDIATEVGRQLDQRLPGKLTQFSKTTGRTATRRSKMGG